MTSLQQSQQSLKPHLSNRKCLSATEVQYIGDIIVEDLYKSEQSLIGYMLYTMLFRDFMHCSQEHLGKALAAWMHRDKPYSRRQIIRILQHVADKLGFIDKQWRGVKKTCIYTLSKILKDPGVRTYLRDLFPFLRSGKVAYRYASLGFFQLVNKALGRVNSKNVTQDKEFSYLNNNSMLNIYSNEAKMGQQSVNNYEKNRGDSKASLILGKDELDPLSEVLRACTIIPFTVAGMVQFAGYDDEILKLGLKDIEDMMVQGKSIYAPVRLLRAQCEKHCTELGRRFDYSKVAQLVTVYEIKPNAPALSGPMPCYTEKQKQQRSYAQAQAHKSWAKPGEKPPKTLLERMADERRLAEYDEKVRVPAEVRQAENHAKVNKLEGEAKERYERNLKMFSAYAWPSDV